MSLKKNYCFIPYIDHYDPVDMRHGIKQYIFLIVDVFSKNVKLYVTKLWTAEIIRSLHKIIIFDRGTAFTSQEFHNFTKQNRIKHILIATNSLQANGQVKRINRTLMPISTKLIKNKTGKY